MKQAAFVLVVLLAPCLALPSHATEPQEPSSRLAEIFAKNQTPIAGMPYMEAFAILKRHRPALRKLPGVEGLSLQEEGLLVYTDQPELVPSTLEGLPVITLPRLGVDDPPAPGEPADREALAHQQEGQRAQPERDCGPYAHWVPEVGRCRVDRLPPHLNKALARTPVPPPAGVIVLRTDGKRDEAEVCPKGFREKSGRHGWRFCIDPAHPQPIPPLWKAPIAGIPFEEAQAILERHRDELWQIPGVMGHGLGAEGIVVHTDQPDLVPTEIEGLPVKTRPPVIMRPLSHTNLLPKRPLRGALKITDQLWPGRGTSS